MFNLFGMLHWYHDTIDCYIIFFINIILFEIHCGEHIVGDMLWVTYCGWHVVGDMLWVTCCGWHVAGENIAQNCYKPGKQAKANLF